MAETVIMPKLGFDMAEGRLVRWVKAEGETVNKGEVLAEIETDKATVEVESNFSGVLARCLVEQGSVVPVGAPIAIIAAPGENPDEVLRGSAAEVKSSVVGEASSMVTSPLPPSSPREELSTGRVFSSPLARKIAREQGIDLGRIRGSGPGGRIVRRDVEAALAVRNASQPAVVEAARATPFTTHALTGIEDTLSPADQRIPVDKLRAAIARRMSEAKQQVPHFYVTHEYDMDALLELRQEVNKLLPEEQKISVNDFLVKAVALTLRSFPNLNASFQGDAIVRHSSINIGVAVALENGLLTVVVRQADVKPVRLISNELREMVSRARQGKVRPEDIEGSTFSISNLGMYDVEHFIAIINPPEAAILAIGSAKQVAAIVNGQVQPRSRMKATLSADHRVTDGAEAARFLQTLAEWIEQPLKLLL